MKRRLKGWEKMSGTQELKSPGRSSSKTVRVLSIGRIAANRWIELSSVGSSRLFIRKLVGGGGGITYRVKGM